jgi:hypothetical protein
VTNGFSATRQILEGLYHRGRAEDCVGTEGILATGLAHLQALTRLGPWRLGGTTLTSAITMPGTEPTSLTEVQAFAWGAKRARPQSLKSPNSRVIAGFPGTWPYFDPRLCHSAS